MKRQTVACIYVLVFMGHTARSQTLEWANQLGSRFSDKSLAVAADRLGSVFISGYTDGSLTGPMSFTSLDPFISKFDSAGNHEWTRQIGTSSIDISVSAAVDGRGNVFITGNTDGSLGGPSAGLSDAFVMKFNDRGTLEWTRQIGTNSNEYSNGISADSLGHVYITGTTRGNIGGQNFGSDDVFVSKLDGAGNLLWSRQIGTRFRESSDGISADNLGSVYITGTSQGNLGGASVGLTDVFISKLDAEGTISWTRRVGSSSLDYSHGISADNLGNVFVAGVLSGNVDGIAPPSPFFVSNFDALGNLIWTHQRPLWEFGDFTGLSADGLGNVFVTGYTTSREGPPNIFNDDAFLAKFDATGNVTWTQQIGTSDDDISYAVSADGLGNVVISGLTRGSLGGPRSGGEDAFVAKFRDNTSVPEPTSLVMIAVVLSGVVGRRNYRRVICTSRYSRS